MWTKWYYKGVPEVGTYVQMVCKNKLDGRVKTFEGVISHYDEHYGYFTYEKYNKLDSDNWLAVKWRADQTGTLKKV